MLETFIIAHDTIWDKYGNEVEVKPLEELAINIKKSSSSGRYEFNVVGNGFELYHTSYAWSLVENTPENLRKLQMIKMNRDFIDELERGNVLIRKQLKNISDFSLD